MLHRRYFSLWDVSKPDIEAFIEQTNLHHPTIKFTAKTSDTETVFRHGCTHTKKGFVKGEALRILWKNSSETTFEENNSNFKKHLMDCGYTQTLMENLTIRNKIHKKGV